MNNLTLKNKNADDKCQHADRKSRRHKMYRDTDLKRHVRRHSQC